MHRIWTLAPHWIVAAVTIFVISCAKPSEEARLPKGSAGAAGSGGSLTRPEDLRSVAEKAFKYVTDRDPRMNVLLRFALAQNFSSRVHNRAMDFLEEDKCPGEATKTTRLPFDGGKLFPKVRDDANKDEVALPFYFEESPIWKMADMKLEFVTDRVCKSETGSDQGFVAAMESKPGYLCVSLYQLAQHDNPFRDAIGYFLSYAIHLGGGQASEAKKWEEDFRRYYSTVQSEMDLQRIHITQGWPALAEAAEALKAKIASHQAAEWTTKDKDDVQKLIKKFHDIRARRLPFPFDPMRLRMALAPEEPARPELFDVYSNSVLVLIDKSSQVYQESEFYKNQAQALSLLDEVLRMIEVVKANLEAYKSGKVVATCISPDYGVAGSILEEPRHRPGNRLDLFIKVPNSTAKKCAGNQDATRTVPVFMAIGSHRSDSRMFMYPPAVNCGRSR